MERAQQRAVDINLRPELNTVVALTQGGLLHVPEPSLQLLNDLGQPGDLK